MGTIQVIINCFIISKWEIFVTLSVHFKFAKYLHITFTEIEQELNDTIQQDIFNDGPTLESMVEMDMTWGQESLNLDPNPYVLQVQPYIENGHLEKLEATIPDQKSAQKSSDQHEVERGAVLKIELNRKISGWIGVILLHSDTKFKKKPLTDIDGGAVFKIDADASDVIETCQPIEQFGNHLMLSVRLKNQDNFNLVIKVDSSNKCSKFCIYYFRITLSKYTYYILLPF